MKWSLIGLVGLGFCAAVCAAILVAGLSGSGLRANTNAQDSGREVTVLVASRPLPAMTVLDASCVKEMVTARSQTTPDALGSSVDVVGKVLARPMVSGQAFTRSAFTEGSGTQLAAMLPRGKRALAISVTGYAGLEGVLYPGSMVDVLASFRSSGAAGVDYREAMTTTLLEGVSVLAIEKMTVVNTDKERKDESDLVAANRVGSTRRVTLLVDVEQAKALQLAMEQGTLALALRNPLDNSTSRNNGVTLTEVLSNSDSFKRGPALDRPAPIAQVTAVAAAATAATLPTTMETAARWETVIMRGNNVETRQFSMPTAH
jgi:pilus assembly protein CpaB